MSNPHPPTVSFVSFSTIYKQNIEDKVKAIDLFLKTTPTPYIPEEVTNLLHISLDELNSIMHQNKIIILDKVNFFKIMQSASSYICRLLQREFKYSGCSFYTPESIAYIYELNPTKVEEAFKKSGLDLITSHNITELFSYIHVPIIRA